jgi:transcription elongation factor Elf1
MSFIDSKYIGLISVRLQKFSKKKEGLYTFRCPYCGDSQKNKNRTRGYIYKHKNDHNFKCHNCGASKSFTNFLRDQDVGLYDQYVMERYKAGLTGKSSNTPDPVLPSSKPHFKKKDFDLQRISELNNSHPAKIYLKNRRIPDKKLRELYFCERFKQWTNTQKHTFDNEDNDESRIIIPLKYKDGIFGFQGRTLNPKSKLRYITVMLDDDKPKIYGLDNIDNTKPIYIVEGPFDSTFIENAVAMCGSDVDIRSLGWSDYIFVFDNEPRNKQICDRISRTIDNGSKVVIWNSKIQQKDLNDMVLAGLDVQDVVSSNTYHGLNAKVKFNGWKKV